MIKKLQIGFVITKTWAIAKEKEDVIKKVMKQSTTWDSFSIKEIKAFSEIEK